MTLVGKLRPHLLLFWRRSSSHPANVRRNGATLLQAQSLHLLLLHGDPHHLVLIRNPSCTVAATDQMGPGRHNSRARYLLVLH